MIFSFLQLSLNIHLEELFPTTETESWFTAHATPETITQFDWTFFADCGDFPPLPADALELDCGSAFRVPAEAAGLSSPTLYRHGASNTLQWGDLFRINYRLGRKHAMGRLRHGTHLTPETFRVGILNPMLQEGLRASAVYPVLANETSCLLYQDRLYHPDGSTCDDSPDTVNNPSPTSQPLLAEKHIAALARWQSEMRA